MADRIDRALAGDTAFWGIQVIDLASGRTLYERNAAHFFVPASNTKLFTTAMALTRLGPDFTGSGRACWRMRFLIAKGVCADHCG